MCFLDFMYFLLVAAYQVTTWVSLSIHCSVIWKDQGEYAVFPIQNVCDGIPGVGHLPSYFLPTTEYLPCKPPPPPKMLIPGVSLGGGRAWAQLELTDA